MGRHEIVPNGMAGIGEPAGDGWHAWVDARELLERTDLMAGCREPVKHYITECGCELPESLEAAQGVCAEPEPLPVAVAKAAARVVPPRRKTTTTEPPLPTKIVP